MRRPILCWTRGPDKLGGLVGKTCQSRACSRLLERVRVLEESLVQGCLNSWQPALFQARMVASEMGHKRVARRKRQQ